MSLIKRLAGAAALIAGAGILYQNLWTRRDRRRFPASGRRIRVGSRNIHVRDSGAGVPAVVLESGIAASSLSWTLVEPLLAGRTRVISYDRAGLGWSDTATGPLGLRTIVEDLRTALRAAAVPSPFLLVGHSFGGLIVRAFAASYPEDVAGLILLDPVLPSEWIGMGEAPKQRLALGIRLAQRGVWLAHLGVVRFSLWLLQSGARALPRVIAKASSGAGSSVASRLVREVKKLPPAIWPAIQAHWSRPQSFQVMSQYLAALPQCAEMVAALPDPSGIPITVISAGNATGEQKREWDRLASLGHPGIHVVAQHSGHWIPFDEPILVVDMICRMVEQVRDSRTGTDTLWTETLLPRN